MMLHFHCSRCSFDAVAPGSASPDCAALEDMQRVCTVQRTGYDRGLTRMRKRLHKDTARSMMYGCSNG
eukprot:CAMPEP_0183403002 /NCGR_PEP_ID=MMETSP0370-20130417/14286_1 /TAXON_ID=268820 /ORGANISM="Peridinium aciculiferum, Strain PAER-2" /LENGTH=67 /DNA_ID=CAMNT_0025584685 /DNA_START=16 /DNA_END=219 /DNA_ORIENTATION=+